jgi:hypothetical protein
MISDNNDGNKNFLSYDNGQTPATVSIPQMHIMAAKSLKFKYYLIPYGRGVAYFKCTDNFIRYYR